MDVTSSAAADLVKIFHQMHISFCIRIRDNDKGWRSKMSIASSSPAEGRMMQERSFSSFDRINIKNNWEVAGDQMNSPHTLMHMPAFLFSQISSFRL
jgi:hypothetical protein